MTQYTFDKTKGQSAIEYLMTYGWMLLVVAIVGGAIFATVQGQCTQSTSGFSGGDVLVENFGLDSDGNLQMEVRNGGANTLDIDSVTVEGVEFIETNAEDTELVFEGDDSIGVGSSETIKLGNSTDSDDDMPFSSSDGCNDFDVEFGYGFQGGGLGDQITSGTLTDSIELNAE